MCVIVDTNVASLVFSARDEYAPLVAWIFYRDGRLIFGGKLRNELATISEVRRVLRTLYQAGRAILIPDDAIQKEELDLQSAGLAESDDYHILALARVSGARILCSSDRRLQSDFKNRRIVPTPKGKIYQSANHVNLLHHTSSCIGRPRRRKEKT